MSQIVNAEAFKAEAKRAAELGLMPEQCLAKYEPDLHAAWKRIYNRHLESVSAERKQTPLHQSHCAPRARKAIAESQSNNVVAL